MTRIRKWRERLGWSQSQLAERAKVRAFYVSGAESALDKIVAAIKAEAETQRTARLRAEREEAIERMWAAADKAEAAAIAQQTLLDVAWELLDRGDAELADKLLDALPRSVAADLLDRFFAEDLREPGAP